MAIHRNRAARPPLDPRANPGPVVVQKVDRLTWRLAMALADGDQERVRVIDARTVLVRNPGSDGSLTVRLNKQDAGAVAQAGRLSARATGLAGTENLAPAARLNPLLAAEQPVVLAALVAVATPRSTLTTAPQ